MVILAAAAGPATPVQLTALVAKPNVPPTTALSIEEADEPFVVFIILVVPV